MTSSVDATYSGLPVTVGIVALGDTYYIQDPISQQWKSVAAADSPVGKLSLNAGTIRILDEITNTTFEGEESKGGVKTYHIKGQVADTEVKAIAGLVDLGVTPTFPTDLYIGVNDGLVYEVDIYGAATAGGDQGLLAQHRPVRPGQVGHRRGAEIVARAQTADKPAVKTKASRRTIYAMVVLCLAVFVAALDQTMVLTVMPSIMRSFYISVRDLNDAGWIITGYLLGYTVAMPLFGRLADVRGRRPMAIVALFLFLVGSAFCVVLSHLGLFIVARVVQAAGGGALVPIAMAAAADMFPPGRRALVLGVIGGSAEAGGVLGPIYGAGLTALWSWRLIFLVNIPLCVILGVATWYLLKPGLGYAASAQAEQALADDKLAEAERIAERRASRQDALVATRAGRLFRRRAHGAGSGRRHSGPRHRHADHRCQQCPGCHAGEVAVVGGRGSLLRRLRALRARP